MNTNINKAHFNIAKQTAMKNNEGVGFDDGLARVLLHDALRRRDQVADFSWHIVRATMDAAELKGGET